MTRVATTFAAIVASVLIGGALTGLGGANPLTAYAAFLDGAVGSIYNLGTSLVKSIPLMLAGLGLAFAFRCGVFNVGAEGQLYFGALGAVLLGTMLDAPPLLHVPLSLAAAFLGGALWAAIPGYLKARWTVNEIITTILLNYVAIYFVSYLVSGPLKDPQGIYPKTAMIASTARLPIILPETRLHAGLILGLIAAVVLYVIQTRTTLGFRVRAVGAGPLASNYAGINVRRTMMTAMLVSGGLAGLAGAAEVLGSQFRLLEYFSPGWGYAAIVVAILGALQPFGVVLAALFFGALESGAYSIQITLGIPTSLMYIIEGLAVLFVLAGIGIRFRSVSRVVQRYISSRSVKESLQADAS